MSSIRKKPAQRSASFRLVARAPATPRTNRTQLARTSSGESSTSVSIQTYIHMLPIPMQPSSPPSLPRGRFRTHCATALMYLIPEAPPPRNDSTTAVSWSRKSEGM